MPKANEMQNMHIARMAMKAQGDGPSFAVATSTASSDLRWMKAKEKARSDMPKSMPMRVRRRRARRPMRSMSRSATIVERKLDRATKMAKATG
jgi:hypothetical protein